MTIPTLHRWPRSVRAAIALQRRLAPRVRLAPVRADVRRVAGVDAAFTPAGTHVVVGVVVWDARAQEVVERCVIRRPVRFPYVPGLLSFREAPAIVALLRRLAVRPDVLLCDGQGLAHPRRLGLACHVGLWLRIPTVGCAKSRLCGDADEPGPRRGSFAPLTLRGERVGDVLRSRDGVKPLVVSPGHLCDFGSARRITLLCARRYRLPEPARLAHQLVSRVRSAGSARIPPARDIQ